MAKKGSKAKTMTAAAASKQLEQLISAKQRQVTDGSLEVILAIASITQLVTIDLTKTPPVTKPKNLGALTFNDPAVGLSDTQMAIFKGNLAAQLPEIAVDIAKIPEKATMTIGAVAEFVRLALLAA